MKPQKETIILDNRLFLEACHTQKPVYFNDKLAVRLPENAEKYEDNLSFFQHFLRVSHDYDIKSSFFAASKRELKINPGEK